MQNSFFFFFFTWFAFYLDISYKENAMRYSPSYMHAHGKQESYLWWTWPLGTPGGCLRWRTEVTPACPRPSPRCRLLARRIRCHLWCIHLCQGQGRIVGRRRDSNIKHLSGMKCQPLNLTMFLYKAFILKGKDNEWRSVWHTTRMFLTPYDTFWKPKLGFHVVSMLPVFCGFQF